ncbi:hypothetical protein GLV96_05420 [Staphylococcus agnetis]|nr:hypothetical protein [Staphylococcus agnetis]
MTAHYYSVYRTKQTFQNPYLTQNTIEKSIKKPYIKQLNSFNVRKNYFLDLNLSHFI